MQEEEKDMAISYAMSDIGLTEEEAEMAFDDFYPEE